MQLEAQIFIIKQVQNEFYTICFCKLREVLSLCLWFSSLTWHKQLSLRSIILLTGETAPSSSHIVLRALLNKAGLQFCKAGELARGLDLFHSMMMVPVKFFYVTC
jgi:hypothetical protein